MEKGNKTEDQSREPLQMSNQYQAKLEEALGELGLRYWEYDIQTKRLYRSALIQNEVGYSAYKENVPESYVDEGIIHPAYARAYLDFYYNLQKGIAGRLVFQSKFASGRWGWLDITYKIICDSDGKPVRAAGIGGDISRHSSVTILRLQGSTFSLEYANDVFYQMTGYTREQYNKNPEGCLQSQLDEKTVKYMQSAIQQAIQSGESQTIEYKLRRADGKELWLCRKFCVVAQEEPGCYLLPAITEDITQRRAAEERLAAERNMYQSLLDEAAALITVVDAKSFRVLYANRAALEATNHLKDGYVGNICYRCIQNADAPCPSCILVRTPVCESETKELDYGGRTYRMTYKKIQWNGTPALLESSEDITEQRRNFTLMEESRKQQARIIDNLPTGIIVFKIENHSYEILQVNPAVCKMMQMDPQKAIGKKDDDLLQLTHPDDLETIRGAMKAMAVPGAEVHYEYRNLNRQTGAYRWTSADGKSERQPDGSMLIYMGYQDITARKEKEEEYKRRIELLAEMDDDNLVAKGRHNLTRNFVIAYSQKSEYAAAIRENSRYDEAVAALAEQVMTKEKREEIIRVTSRDGLLGQFAMGKTDGAVEFRRRMADHTARWTVVKYNLFEEPESHDIMAFMYSYDISDRVRENRILSKISSMEYDLMGLIDARTQSYTIIAQLMKGKVMSKVGDFNSAAAKRILETADDAERASLLQQITVNAVLEQLKDKEVYSVMYSIRGEDGIQLRKRLQFSFLDEEKETVMFFRSDITEMYEKEQTQLRKIEAALRSANQANLAKTEFFSRMSHDMRTPMNGILGLSELSRDETDPEALQASMAKIYESGQYLLGLINDTLDFQRIESGRLKLEPQIVNAAELVGNTIDMIRQSAEAKGVQLSVKNSNADLNWYVRIDPMRMKQVFINLLSNAVKFTPAGGSVDLEFSILSRDGMISRDLITVRDTGIGMSEEFLKSGIFQPFSQENNAVTTQYAGSGLGLSIAKSLVELMGGRIEVESEQGVGTTFSVYIDFERVGREEVHSAAQNSLRRSDMVHQELLGKRILLVEDHPLNAEIATRLLKKVGCEVDWLPNGAEAVKRFELGAGASYDLVLMDIRMPVMDGLEAAKRIRALHTDSARSIPIIAMTANAYEEDIRHSREAGMNAHLSKPIDANVFYDTLVKYVAQTSSET